MYLRTCAAALLIFGGGIALRGETPAPSAMPSATAVEPVPATAPLTKEELESATRIDSLTIPSPGELMAALSKEAKPNWQGQYRQPIPTTFASRAQIAMNIGGLIADGYIALEAADSQQVKNIGKDVITLAKSLAVSENVIARGNSIFEFAENNEWSALKEELEATQNEVKLALEEQRDGDLVWLVTLGGWVRGTEAVSSWIAANYTPQSAKLLRQPAVVELIRSRILRLPERMRNDELLEEVLEKLDEIERLVSFPEGTTPTQEQVRELRDLTGKLVARISQK